MIKKIMKKTFSLSMLLLVVFSYTVSPMPTYAAKKTKEPETLGDLKELLSDLKKQKAENDRKEQAAKDEIKKKEQAIKQAEADIHQAEADIEEAEQKIEESNEGIEEFKGATEKAMKALQQMKSSNAYMQYITDSASLTELIMRVKAMEQITDAYQKNIDSLDKLIKQNEQLKIDLNKKQQDLEAKIPTYQDAIIALHGSLEEYDEFALDINEQIKVAQDNVNSYVKLCADSKKSYLGDAELLSDCIDIPYNAGWLKPLNKGVVTSPWGGRIHPTKGNYQNHSGIDIGGVAEGTPIYAAAGGRVSGVVPHKSRASKEDCGGNKLYIDVIVGGVKYTTYYYHLLNFNVKQGDIVTQNTIIGYVGGGSTAYSRGGYDTCTTGAHLHYGVMTGAYAGSTPISRQISPPGFNNKKGYKFTSRYDYYG